MIYVLIALCALIFVYLFLIFPSPKKKGDLFKKQPLYAHRGLFGGDIPENSMTAFEKAAEAGYGIELDVHVTADGVCVVHHDDSLARMCGVEKSIEKSDYADIKDAKLPDGSTLPLFTEVLSLVGGRVPLIVELKCEKTDVRVADAAAEILKNYGGEYCIESFDPVVVARYKKKKLGVMCGQLAGRTYAKGDKIKRRVIKFAAENLLFNVISRPDFVAYEYKHRHNLSFVIDRLFGAETAYWTITNEKARDDGLKRRAAVIFQDFIA